MMLEIPDMLTADEVRRCLGELERASWHDGRRTAGHLAAHAKHNQQLAHDDPLGTRIGDFILQRLGRNERFMAAALPLKVLPPRFNRYADSGSYGDHIDNAVFSVPGTPHRIRADLSATLFLSDPKDYDGGELVVVKDEGARETRLSAGHMLLYSAGSVHRVRPVTRGVRFAAFFWIQSLVREEERRSLLLELDDTIRALGTETPGSPAILRLTGLYHNLLRQWAET